jgi:hypothetical protein
LGDLSNCCALDVHQATMTAAVRDAEGKLLMESSLETKSEVLLQFFAGLRGTLHVTLEEGTWATWLYDLLRPHVAELLVSLLYRFYPQFNESPLPFIEALLLPWGGSEGPVGTLWVVAPSDRRKFELEDDYRTSSDCTCGAQPGETCESIGLPCPPYLAAPAPQLTVPYSNVTWKAIRALAPKLKTAIEAVRIWITARRNDAATAHDSRNLHSIAVHCKSGTT